MKKVAFKMQLFQGKVQEYQKRHDELWPELSLLLKNAGVEDYSIFFDEETHSLFGILKIENTMLLEKLSQHPIMQKWWAYMSDIMVTNPDKSPVSISLQEVFYLP